MNTWTFVKRILGRTAVSTSPDDTTWTTTRELDRKFVAGYLRQMALCVEEYRVNGFSIEWKQGKRDLDVSFQCHKPVDHIALDFSKVMTNV